MSHFYLNRTSILFYIKYLKKGTNGTKCDICLGSVMRRHFWYFLLNYRASTASLVSGGKGKESQFFKTSIAVF